MELSNDLSLKWLDSELHRRLESRVAAGHPWKQLLQTASKETVTEIFKALQAYASLWSPLESRKKNGVPFNKSTILELFSAAEQDLERGLSFIREVEKGSHMRAEAILRFRPEAIKALCELCSGRIDALDSQRSEDAGQGGEEDEDENEAEVDREEETSNTLPKGGLAQSSEAVKVLIDTVYQNIDPQFRDRLQLLVHKHKTKARSK